ncbi:thioredoxin family protein, partial [Candidatus Peregrinibacteria bacterium CG_4_10_14_0_2_um_filter_41_8]
MALLTSKNLPMGMEAPIFENLPSIDGKTYSLDDFYRYKAVVIIFMCVHCP